MIGPRAMDSRPNLAALDRRTSTKHLISRYESMATQPAAPSKSRPTFNTAELSPPPALPHFASKKDKSSVRQSFRNLMGIFKKGDSKFKLNQVFSGKRASSAYGEDSLRSRTTAPASQVGMSGTVLYMARVSDGVSMNSILPVWTTSTASLAMPHLVISSVSINGHPDTQMISLQDVSDVRSLTSHEFDSEELALLPKDYELEDLRFFEILMDGKPRERFAVTSLHERADWVSSIWFVGNVNCSCTC